MILEFYGMSDTHYSFIAIRLFSNNRKMLTKKEVQVPKTFSLFWDREVVSWEGKKKKKAKAFYTIYQGIGCFLGGTSGK